MFTYVDIYLKRTYPISALHDGDAKEKVFLEILHDLPDENYYTVVSVVEHLVR